MDTVFGFVGEDFSLVAADTSQVRSVIVFKQDADKIYKLEDRKILGCSGPMADRTAFGEYIQKNLSLYNLRTGLTQSCHATASFIRTELATALRRGPYQVNCLFGGFDLPGAGDEEGAKGKPALYWIDYMGSMQSANFGAQGYAAFFLYSLFDAHWKVSQLALLLPAPASRLFPSFPARPALHVAPEGSDTICARCPAPPPDSLA